jgi:predicted metal-dependent peptidase
MNMQMTKAFKLAAMSVAQTPAEDVMSESDKAALAQKVRDLVSKALTRMISRVKFFGYLGLQMRPRMAEPHEGVPTAGIAPDGTVVINPDFFLPLSIKEAAGVLAHEACHPGLHFWGRKGSRNHLLFNIAHDLSFNFMIEEMAGGEIELPKGALLDPKFHGMAAEAIYSHLQKGDQGTPGITNIKCKGGGDINIDVNGGGDGTGGEAYGDCREDLSSTKDGKKAARGDKGAQQKLSNNWKINIAQAAQAHEKSNGKGSLPAGLRRYIDNLLHPKLEWEEELRRWCGENGKPDDYSFRRPSRRSYGIGTVLPGLYSAGMPDVMLLIDSSGSMSTAEIKRGISEAHGILEALDCEIRVMVCDAAVHVDMTVEDAMDIEIKGGGGSSFIPAFEAIHETGFQGAVICFTDGMIDVPTEMPNGMKGCLWLSSPGYGPPTEAWGEHIVIEAEDKD